MEKMNYKEKLIFLKTIRLVFVSNFMKICTVLMELDVSSYILKETPIRNPNLMLIIKRN